ncbi:unnamed protein product [Calypogeia fissa]
MPGGAGEHDDVSRDDDWQQQQQLEEEEEEQQGEENIGAMSNHVVEEEELEEEQDVDIGDEEEIVRVVDVEDEDDENIEIVDVDGEDEEEENVDVDVDGDGENGEEVVGFGEQQQQTKFDLVVGEEEDNVDVDVDIDDDDEDQQPSPPQSSKPALGIEHPLTSVTNSGVLSTVAATASSTNLNTTAEDEVVSALHGGFSSSRPSSSSPGHPHAGAPSIVSPRGLPKFPTSMPTTVAADVVEATTTRIADDFVSPTVEIVSGANESDVTTAAGVQFITSKMVVDIAPPTTTARQDVVPNPQAIKQADSVPSTTGVSSDLASATTNEVKASASSPFDHLKEPKEPPANMDDKSSDVLLRKNSIQDSKVNLGTEMENALRILASRKAAYTSSDAPELNQTELKSDDPQEEGEDVPRTSGNRDQLMPDAAAAGGAVVQKRDENMAAAAAEKDTEPSGSSNHDPRAFDGLNALTSAIDIGQARDALAKLQPKLDNGTDAAVGSEAAAGNSAGGMADEKTELEREMELFEAAEREEEARLLASMRSSDQSIHGGGDTTMKEAMVNDRKRASESIPNEARKKRGKRIVLGDEGKEEEDVCFICFDGGELVLCDRRSCPKAYHLNCIGRDTAFFQKKGAWICGWHFCSICTKPANFQCYTCPTAYCSSCLDQADFHCVRNRKGLCEECWPIVQMIENKETVNLDEGVEVDFTDQETYEGLFKEYWEELKLRWSLSPEELDKDGKGAGGSAAVLDGSDEDKVDAEDYMFESGNEEDEEPEEDEEDDMEALDAAKRRKRRRGKAKALLAEGVEGDPDTGFGSDEDDDAMELGDEDADEQDDDGKPTHPPREYDGWASKELIEFVKYMNEDPKKPLSRFQVTKLLWSYIKSEKLQDPRKKTQIQCDERLRTIFGKKTVGQFEMFKHLQSHFAPKGVRRAGRQLREEQVSLDDEGVDADGSAADDKFSKVKDVRDRRRRRKGDEEKFERPNVDEFAAVNPKNIGLIYLRRQLLEELLDDPEFEIKVCNTFVRIRVPGMQSKSEMCYRLVQVVGTRLQTEHYKAGRKVTNYVLEILNLQKREDVTVDLVSNHDFSEEECQRLRQSIKCGFIKTLTVGDIEEKSKELQEAKVNDWFETERQRLVNLRDRASEKGRKKELRECVEKLQELNSPAFRAAKLKARPEVTADPRMDPNYESDTNDDHARDGRSKILDKSTSPGERINPVSILKGGQNESSRVDWEGAKIKQSAWVDTHRSKEGDRLYDSGRSSDKLSYGRPTYSYGVESAKERGYDERERGWGVDQQNDGTADAGWVGNGRNRSTPGQKWNEKVDLSINVDARSVDIRSVDARSARSDYRGGAGMSTTPVFDPKADWPPRREPAPPATPSLPQAFPVPAPNVVTQSAIDAGEKEKIWHYMDPTGMVQGPFAMEQLRKWNTTGYFPEDLRIWKATQTREESILLTDALAGRFQKEREPWNSAARVVNPVVASIQEDIAQALTTSSSLPFNNPALKSADGWRENGAASNWTDRAGSGDVGRSANWGGVDVSQNSRPFARDSETGPTAPLRDNSIDMKWKPGPAAGTFDSYGRSTYNSSESRSGRADAAAKFDPANWGSRSTSGRPERDSWNSSGGPGNEGGGYSSFGGRSSVGRGSNYRDSGGKWNPDGSSDISRSSSRSATRAARKDIPCRFHQKGYCKRGDSCDFWHG